MKTKLTFLTLALFCVCVVSATLPVQAGDGILHTGGKAAPTPEPPRGAPAPDRKTFDGIPSFWDFVVNLFG